MPSAPKIGGRPAADQSAPLAEASRRDDVEEAGRRFWNEWNSRYRSDDMRLPPPNQRQADTVLEWIHALGRTPLDIVEVGCGSGWLCERMLPFGSVLGVDIADEVIEVARRRCPGIRFVAADFLAFELPAASADVVVSLEALSHVADQKAFLSRIAKLLRKDGSLMLATQNRFVLERMDGVGPPGPGQIRNWVDAPQLRELLAERFDIVRLTSLHPAGHRGILRMLNSAKLSVLLRKLGLQGAWLRFLESRLLGHTLIVLARKKGEAD